ncbi:hypothetical protein N9L30_00540 [Burkholderiaceae bacterium]|jgi:hypothetical protein|nr:hypothetical protein [Burkholderiaceae bacterium]MDB0048113.1 hypothetical protein [Burkholderiaceae bacterium]
MALHQKTAVALAAVKWPIAFLSLLSLPFTASATVDLCLTHIRSALWLTSGILCYFAVWFFAIRHWRHQWLSTLEHELTHCLFALLSGNRVTGLNVTVKDGGHMTFTGSENWLIDTSPYFFPTVTVILILLMPWLPTLHTPAGQFFIGVTLSYHLTSTWTETHSGQTDIQKAGVLFCWLFLPGANVAFLGIVLSAAIGGWGTAGSWIESTFLSFMLVTRGF